MPQFLGNLHELGKSLEINTNFWATAEKPGYDLSNESLPSPENGQAVLSSWHHLLDKGTLQEGEPYLAATARTAVIRVSPATAKSLGLVDGGTATVSCADVPVVAPVVVTASMVDGVVWMPSNSEGADLNLPSGTIVDVTAGGAA